MSFSCNPKPDKRPGLICGNPLSGLCERACIEVNKVFDACLNQSSLENYSLTLTDAVPSSPTTPLTFVSGISTSTTGQISNPVITKLNDNSGLSRVQATVGIPVEVIYVDSNETEGKATGTVSVPIDCIMCVPDGGLVPVGLSANVSAIIPQATYKSDLTFTATVCLTIVLKVTATVQLMVPTYGYCEIPPCQEYTQEACTGMFEMPLYPENCPMGRN